MSLIHKAKIFFFAHHFNVFGAHVSDAISCNCDSIILCSSLYYFLLLKLIIHDFNLLFCWVFELFSKNGIASCNCYCRRVYFWKSAWYIFSDLHHGSIGNLRISLNLKLSIFTHWNKSTKHCFPWYCNIVENKISIVFAMESYFWPNVSNLYSRKWIHVLISDLNKKCMNSMAFTFNNECGENQSMCRY